ncbi:MAG: hypothetical protein LWW95_07105 [Candidatus Desulfofervidus auxilii]|nr:hypothetical protein [Candidatus Desulfofervidus auxilii]
MDEREIKEYIRELVIERIIYRDIPESFGVEDTEIIRILAEYIFENPGIILNIDALSRNLGRHKKTIRNALNYLELSFLIKRTSNLRGSFLATSRKNKKVDKKDTKGLLKFCSLFNIDKAYLINREEDGIIRIDDKEIVVIPITKFLLL